MHCDSKIAKISLRTKNSRCMTSYSIERIRILYRRSSSIYLFVSKPNEKKKKKDEEFQSKSVDVDRFKRAFPTHFAYKYVRINRGTLNSVMRMDPFAADPRWYFNSLQMAMMTGESVGLRKYQNATAPARANCWQAEKNKSIMIHCSPRLQHCAMSKELTENKFTRPN